MIDHLPENISEAVDMLLSDIDDNGKIWMRETTYDQVISHLHHGCGTHMRNEWGLWEKDSPMSVWFRKHGLWHADDFSSIIYKALWCHLNSKSFDIAAEAKYYANYWRIHGVGFDGVKLK